MQNKQSNSTGGVEGITPEATSDSAPELNGFYASGLSQSVPEPNDYVSDTVSQPPGERGGVSPDELFEVLSNRRRRYVLYFLKRGSADVELGPLATQIAAWENDIPVGRVSGAERKRVYTSLQQVHLPKMDSIDILTFDKRAGTISASSSLTGVELQPGTLESEPAWGTYYMGLATVNATIIGLHGLNVWPLTGLSGLAVATLVAVSMLVLSMLHIRSER